MEVILIFTLPDGITPLQSHTSNRYIIVLIIVLIIKYVHFSGLNFVITNICDQHEWDRSVNECDQLEPTNGHKISVVGTKQSY